MGGIISRLVENYLGNIEVRILMLGLDNAGKTTLLNQLKVGEVVSTRPTIGFNIGTVKYRNLNFTVFDIGGQVAVRDLWCHYYPNTDAIIFVVDASDVARLAQAKGELHNMLCHPHLANAALLVFANKNDLPNALRPAMVSVHLNLHHLPPSRKCHIEACSATTGVGIYEGLDKLRNMLINK